MSKNSFGSQATLQVGADSYTIYRLDAVYKKYPQAAKLPFSLKILLENLLRTEDGVAGDVADIEAIAKWEATAEPSQEPEPRAPPGLHRRALRRGPRRHARRDEAHGR